VEDVSSEGITKLFAETVPGRVTVFPDCPIVIEVAVELPILIVLAPSILTAPSPVTVVPLNVKAAEAIEIVAKMANAMAAPAPELNSKARGLVG
jgi:hypothetical protein